MDKGTYMMCKIKLPIAADSCEANSRDCDQICSGSWCVFNTCPPQKFLVTIHLEKVFSQASKVIPFPSRFVQFTCVSYTPIEREK